MKLPNMLFFGAIFALKIASTMNLLSKKSVRLIDQLTEIRLESQ